MMAWKRYLAAYLVGAIAGLVIELLIGGRRHHCVRRPDLGCLLAATVASLYGYGAVISLAVLDYWDRVPGVSLPVQWLVAMFLVTAFECLAGRVSLRFHGYQTWRYTADMHPACGGSVSVASTLFFGLLFLAFAAWIRPLLPKA